MSGSVLKNLRLFSSMCGSTSMPNTILVTTMWSTVKPEIGQVREEELKKTFWNEMIASGCKVLRFEGTKESAWEIVGNAPTYNPATIQISREMVDVDLRLNETQAGIELNKELQRLIKDRKVAMRQIQEQIQKGGNEITLQELNQRRADIDAKIELTASELRKLKIPFSRSIKVFFKKMGSGVLVFLHCCIANMARRFIILGNDDCGVPTHVVWRASVSTTERCTKRKLVLMLH